MSTETMENIPVTDTVAPVAPPKAPARTRPSRAKPPAGKQSARANSPKQTAPVVQVAPDAPSPATTVADILATAGIPTPTDQHAPFVGGVSPIIAAASAETKTIYVPSADGSRWEERVVPLIDAPAETIFDPGEVVLGDITLQWEEMGRTQMDWKWVHMDAKYSYRERSQGYRAVDPTRVRLTGYTVRDVPGTGKCYTHMDCVLMEIPMFMAQGYRDQFNRDQAANQIARARGIQQHNDETNKRSDGLVTVQEGLDSEIQTFRNPLVEEQNALARSMAHGQKLSGNPNFFRDVAVR